MRFAFADPPYPGQSARLYGEHEDYAGEVDHGELVARLVRDYPDGWALSTGAKWLREVLLLCPENVRVLSWHKPMSPPFSVRVQYGWEPVILRGGRPYDGGPRTVRDTLVASPHTFVRDATWAKHVTGQKPPEFCRWIFECFGAVPGDTLDDVFPGSGAVTREWERFIAQPNLFDGPPGEQLSIPA